MTCALRLTTLALRNSCTRGIVTGIIRGKPLQIPVCGVVAACSTSAANQSEGTEKSSEGMSWKPGDVLKRDDIYPHVDPEISIQYMDSEAYKTAYGDEPLWKYYRRNFKGQWAPETRRTCIRGGRLATGNPCPVCRDEYLVIHPENVKLLTQFISPYTGEILPSKTTGICQTQLKKLKVAVRVAEDQGLIEGRVPFRKYKYEEYLDQPVTL